MSGIKLNRQVGRPSKAGKAIELWLLDVATWLRNWQLANDRYTQRSGSSVNSYEIEIEKDPDSGELSVGSSLGWALFGRKAGGRPPVDALAQWIKDKPLNITGERNIMSAAYAIAKMIERRGTPADKVKLRPQNIDLVIENFGKKYLPTLGNELADDIATQIAKTTDTRKI